MDQINFYVFWSDKLIDMFLVRQILFLHFLVDQTNFFTFFGWRISYLLRFWSTKFILTFLGGPNSFLGFLVHQINCYVFRPPNVFSLNLVDQIYLNAFWWTKFLFTFFGPPNSYFLPILVDQLVRTLFGGPNFSLLF